MTAQFLAVLLARYPNRQWRIVTELYHNDDAALKRVMAKVGIEEEQDLISRLIRGADRMTQDDLESLVRL